jgi:threonine dehydrogenase-like Zn-dependent dehydrogenase
MKALAWHGKRDVRVDQVPDPTIEEPTDAIVRITTNICGSDLHLYMCAQGLQTQCETTQVREHGIGAALFGYVKVLLNP